MTMQEVPPQAPTDPTAGVEQTAQPVVGEGAVITPVPGEVDVAGHIAGVTGTVVEAPAPPATPNAAPAVPTQNGDTITPPPPPAPPTSGEATPPTKRGGLGKKIAVAGAILGGAIAGGATVAVVSGGDSTPVTAGGSDPTEQPTTTGEATQEAATTTPEYDYETATDVGNIRIGRIIDGEPTITVTRANGMTAEVPKLRELTDKTDAEQVRLFAESGLALFACYMSTGDQVCLDELSSNPTVHTLLQETRQNTSVKILANFGEAGLEGEAQFSIFDDNENRAIFVSGVESGPQKRETVELSAGSLYFYADSASIDNTQIWQGPDVHRKTAKNTFIVEDFEFRLAEKNGKTVVDGLEFNTDYAVPQ